ncbi:MULTISPECIES: thioesterase family protein [unclassified Pseudoalteromonas]|uniref:acyl-CoA thioesterase n=1 Tax=unclassified Pseudoalteromonas TaxID=194690 RepID=UPI0020973F87|nr:thioesterase family protein [Pseudoalteromonas sp. XMcav2-N]MCO7190525.1 thioesterase family protein [Pseudoalteromonas sp. XMcav2-N]
MTFDELISLPALKNTQAQLTLPASWGQGRTVFGGLSAALMLQSMLHQLGDQNRRLLSFSCNFVGPLLSDQPFELNTLLLRSGKNASQMQTTITQNNQVCLVALASFGKPRTSSVSVPADDVFTLQQVNPKQTLPYTEGVMPAFIQHIDLNLQQGALPFSGADSSHIGGWMKFKTPAQPHLSVLHLLALADAWPPTLLQLCKGPTPASSMSWYIEFLSDIELPGLQWFAMEAVTHQAEHGYAIEDAKLFSQDGRLLALSRQTVAVFDG